MEKTINVKKEYNSLDSLLSYLKSSSSLECSKEYDIWEMRTDVNGQMEQCLVLKKSAMHGLKIHFPNERSLKMSYIIPNKIMNAYFGKSEKARRNIIEIIAGIIKQTVLAPSQKNAFVELSAELNKVAA